MDIHSIRKTVLSFFLLYLLHLAVSVTCELSYPFGTEQQLSLDNPVRFDFNNEYYASGFATNYNESGGPGVTLPVKFIVSASEKKWIWVLANPQGFVVYANATTAFFTYGPAPGLCFVVSNFTYDTQVYAWSSLLLFKHVTFDASIGEDIWLEENESEQDESSLDDQPDHKHPECNHCQPVREKNLRMYTGLVERDIGSCCIYITVTNFVDHKNRIRLQTYAQQVPDPTVSGNTNLTIRGSFQTGFEVHDMIRRVRPSDFDDWPVCENVIDFCDTVYKPWGFCNDTDQCVVPYHINPPPEKSVASHPLDTLLYKVEPFTQNPSFSHPWLRNVDMDRAIRNLPKDVLNKLGIGFK